MSSSPTPLFNFLSNELMQPLKCPMTVALCVSYFLAMIFYVYIQSVLSAEVISIFK